MSVRVTGARGGRADSSHRERVVSVRDLVVGYDRRPVLQGVSLDIHAGEVVAVLGPNGSGKSTLVRGILGLVPRLAGTVEIFGAPLDQLTERYRLGYVPQRQTVSPGVPATVREVVATGRLNRVRPWQRYGARDRDAISAAIDTVGLTGRGEDPLHVLSGGQQRRALLARALAGEPDLLVLDEPTAGVDAASQEAFTSTLASLAAQGKTSLIVAHELGALAPILTRVIVLRAGRIEYDGLPRVHDHVDTGGHHHEDEPAPLRFAPDGPRDRP